MAITKHPWLARLAAVPALMFVVLVVGCAKRPPSTSSLDGPVALPRAAALPSPRDFHSTTALRDTHFDFDRYDVRPDAGKILVENAAWLKANPNHLLLIEGHADERGSTDYNLALGDRRAKSAKDYLVAHGVPTGRVTILSYGKERPFCTEHSEACWAQNRRAHFLIKEQ